MLKATALFLVLMSVSQPVQANAALRGELRTQISRLLQRYQQKDISGVLGMLDTEGVLMMGTDVSEVATSRHAIEQLLRSDFMRWDSSSFGTAQIIFMRASGSIATAYFDVPWTATNRLQKRLYVIRMATTWHKIGKRWKLAQLTNSVPTNNQ